MTPPSITPFTAMESYSQPEPHKSAPESIPTTDTMDVTPCSGDGTGSWFEIMTSTKPLGESSPTLPYYVKKPSKNNNNKSNTQNAGVDVSSSKYGDDSSQCNEDAKSGVKNVLDGHVWTLEPEDPSNQVSCITLLLLEPQLGKISIGEIVFSSNHKSASTCHPE